MSIMNNEAEYRAALETAHKEFPPWNNLKYTPATCPCHDYSFVVFCDGSDWDIARCRKCGDETIIRCNFDDDYD